MMNENREARKRYRIFRRIVKRQFKLFMAGMDGVYDITGVHELSDAMKAIAQRAVDRINPSGSRS